MVCQQLDQLEWDFIQARAESREIDSLGWTEREYSCLDAIPCRLMSHSLNMHLENSFPSRTTRTRSNFLFAKTVTSAPNHRQTNA